jgi:hypothetical protein
VRSDLVEARPAAPTPTGRLRRSLGVERTLDVITLAVVSMQGLALFLLMARGGWLIDDFVFSALDKSGIECRLSAISSAWPCR